MKRILSLGVWVSCLSGGPASVAAGEAAAARAEVSSQLGALTGRVTDGPTGNALQGAEVRILGTAFETFTDSAGEFRFSRVPAGEYQIRAAYLGISPGTAWITVNADTTVTADLRLGAEVLVME